MDAVRKMCIEELGFPPESLVFYETEKPGDDNCAASDARTVIDRDEKGRWNACLSARMTPPVGGGYLLTYKGYYSAFFG